LRCVALALRLRLRGARALKLGLQRARLGFGSSRHLRRHRLAARPHGCNCRLFEGSYLLLGCLSARRQRVELAANGLDEALHLLRGAHGRQWGLGVR
jgi:hypothetical protein